ncbi:MAG TPA: hypothetical protein VGJ60_09785 [Chloroflexota bacterium]
MSQIEDAIQPPGSRDGTGAGDHDVPYQFGRRPSVVAPYPFTTRQFARLLVLRSRLQASVTAVDRRYLSGRAPRRNARANSN